MTPTGIVLGTDSDGTERKLHDDDTKTSTYGYVDGSTSPSSSGWTLKVVDNMIMWDGVDIKEGQQLITTVNNVKIESTTGNYEWVVNVNPTEFDTDDNPIAVGAVGYEAGVNVEEESDRKKDGRAFLSVVKIAEKAVLLEVEGTSSFPAASKQEIQFRFTAVDTPIRDGKVWLKIPSGLGSAPALPAAVAKTAGKVSASHR